MGGVRGGEGRMEAGRKVEGNGASLKCLLRQGNVPFFYPKSSQEGLTVCFVDRLHGGQTFSHLEGEAEAEVYWENKGGLSGEGSAGSLQGP